MPFLINNRSMMRAVLTINKKHKQFYQSSFDYHQNDALFLCMWRVISAGRLSIVGVLHCDLSLLMKNMKRAFCFNLDDSSPVQNRKGKLYPLKMREDVFCKMNFLFRTESV